MFDSISRYGGSHDSLDDFSRKNRKALEKLMHDDEEFVTAITCKDAEDKELLLRNATKLILTTQRIIRFERGWLRQHTEDYALDEITSVEYDKGIAEGVIKLQGAGIDDSYHAKPKTGQQFVTKVSEHQRTAGGIDV